MIMMMMMMMMMMMTSAPQEDDAVKIEAKDNSGKLSPDLLLGRVGTGQQVRKTRTHYKLLSS